MTFKQFLELQEKFGHPNWGGDRTKNGHAFRNNIRRNSFKVQKPFMGIRADDKKKFFM